jgi:hypothetical protein
LVCTRELAPLFFAPALPPLFFAAGVLRLGAALVFFGAAFLVAGFVAMRA